MAEKKARSVFIPISITAVVVLVAAMALLTVVPLKTCECRSEEWALEEAKRGGELPCFTCWGEGRLIVWDLWGIQEPPTLEFDVQISPKYH